MVVDPNLRRGRPSVDDLTMHLRLLYLLPYTVHVDHAATRADNERRQARERAARLLARVPAQRPPTGLENYRKARR